ncbi:hypothetical protein BDW62DRAFT_199912 [Aspergillus aurantiobrunneus]
MEAEPGTAWDDAVLEKAAGLRASDEQNRPGGETPQPGLSITDKPFKTTMTVLPDFDPYEVLGVAKDASVTEIKSSHRKLVLKCHPDKIKDESQRSEAQDQFQKVQQAYEILSDDKSREKYDNKVKLAELKREMMAQGAYPRPSQREYRDGRFYEERVPADPEAFFEDEARFAESPRPTSRKHEEYGARPRSRATDEKRRSKPAPSSSSTRAAKEARESTKASRADRDKYRTKERRRATYEKQVYPDSESEDYDSDKSEVYFIPVKRPSESRRHRDSKPRPTESSRRSKTHYRDDDEEYYSDERDYKHDKHDMQYSSAWDYIRRSKETIPDSDRRHRSSHSPLRYDSGEPEVSRHSGRTKRSGRDTRPPTSHHSSSEHLDPSLPRAHEKVPSMPTTSTFPSSKGSSSPRPSHQHSRSSHVRSQSRSTREGSRRSEPVYVGMGIYTEPKASRLRGEKSDSGYASSSPTPEIPEASPKPRYKGRPEPVIIEPSTQPPPLRHARTYSPPHAERRMPPRSSTTYTYPTEPTSRRTLYREVEPDVQYIPIRPPRAGHSQSYHDTYTRHAGRRQSAC